MILISFLLAAATIPPMTVTCATITVPDATILHDNRTTDKTICRMYDSEKDIVCYWVVEFTGEHLTCLSSK